MRIEIKSVKKEAKALIRDRRKKIYLAAGAFLLLLFVLLALDLFLTDDVIVQDRIPALNPEDYLLADDTVDWKRMMEDMAEASRSSQFIDPTRLNGTERLFSTLLELLACLWLVGLSSYMLRFSRGREEGVVNLLDGFLFPFKALFLMFLVLMSLWISFMFPLAFILYFAARQAVFLLIDHPEWSSGQCITASYLLMKGRKWELFRLDLSFAGWIILAYLLLSFLIVFSGNLMGILLFGLPLLLVLVHAVSLIKVSCACYYNRLVGFESGEGTV